MDCSRNAGHSSGEGMKSFNNTSYKTRAEKNPNHPKPNSFSCKGTEQGLLTSLFHGKVVRAFFWSEWPSSRQGCACAVCENFTLDLWMFLEDVPWLKHSCCPRDRNQARKAYGLSHIAGQRGWWFSFLAFQAQKYKVPTGYFEWREIAGTSEVSPN